MNETNNLLEQVNITQQKYDEIAKTTGENFNVFYIMRAESDEVRTHSRIIAEFLNPKGIHNQGTFFLKLFFEEIPSLNDIKEHFDYENAKIIVEEFLGNIDTEYSKGGYIDIVIKDSKNQIVIENKIYAGDQKGQLLRYRSNYPGCKLIYLTLDGKIPSEYSYKIGHQKDLKIEEIILISYKDEIKNWIEKSIDKVHSLPIIKETLVQYLYLIKKLTNQSTNKKMSTEIQNLILNNFSAAEKIVKEFDGIKYKICGSVRTNLINVLETKLNDKFHITTADSKVGDKNSKIWIEQKEYFGNSLLFGIEPFSGNGNKGTELFFGIIDLNAKNKNLFEDLPNYLQTGWWREKIYFNDFESFKVDFSDANFISFLGKNKNKKDELVSALSQQIIDYIKIRENDMIEFHKRINGTHNN
jgi:hypothetical protein